jgi:NitT/TauT family transport system ATP-binding protein
MKAPVEVHAGFLPLMDAAILVAAREKGFLQEQGIDLHLHRETSWANIRDRMSVGHFDVAHMLAPMPIAAVLQLTPMPLDVIVPMALGLGGNAVTLSDALYRQMQDAGMQEPVPSASSGAALRRVVEDHAAGRKPKIAFGIVHPHSSHSYDLRYWLAASGISPESDVEFLVVPPPLMPDALKTGQIDGFCVGEPWSSVAALSGSGWIVTTKSQIWRSSPEKVLAVSSRFAGENGEALLSMIRGLVQAAQWCCDAGNNGELAELLSKPQYVGIDGSILQMALEGSFIQPDGSRIKAPAFFIPFERAANFPWKSHALWLYSQMVRWGQADFRQASIRKIEDIWRPDIYRAAVEQIGIAVPSANSKVEGALQGTVPVGVGKGELLLGPDGFFDGETFDPDLIEQYVRKQMPLG